MRYYKIIICLFCSLAISPISTSLADTKNWQETAKQVLSLANDMDARTKNSAKLQNEDEKALSAKLEKLKAIVKKNSAELAAKNEELNKVSQRRAELADQYEQEMSDMKTVEGSFRTSLRATIARLEVSPTSSTAPERLKSLQTINEQDSFFGLTEMKLYTDILFADIADTGQIKHVQAPVINLDGTVQPVELYRAGGFILSYNKNGNAFYASSNGNAPASTIASSGNNQKLLLKWLTNESDILPMDITGGTALKAQTQQKDLKQWVEDGGLLLYPILIAGLVGSILFVIKLCQLSLNKCLPSKLKLQITNYNDLAKDEQDNLFLKIERLKLCPTSQVITALKNKENLSVEALDNVFDEKIIQKQGRLERGLSIIGVLASIAPLLGLLGTVTGMINTFQAITIFGTGDPRMMSTGISEALITTQAGLAIAIPLLLGHHFLKRRTSRLIADMEESGTAMLANLYK